MKPVDVERQLAALCVALFTMAGPAQANGDDLMLRPGAQPTEQASGTSDSLLDFAIPAQPLADALDRYAYLTRRPVIYPGDLAFGRMASAVRGRFSPEAALQLLLQGSGLSARKLRTPAGETFILSEVPDGTDSPRGETSALLANPNGFHGQVQANILQALCAHPNTAPGNYSALLRFRLDADGTVRDARLLDRTGSSARDAAILSALGQLRMMPPPRHLAGQSLTMAVLPQGPDAHVQCPSSTHAN